MRSNFLWYLGGSRRWIPEPEQQMWGWPRTPQIAKVGSMCPVFQIGRSREVSDVLQIPQEELNFCFAHLPVWVPLGVWVYISSSSLDPQEPCQPHCDFLFFLLFKKSNIMIMLNSVDIMSKLKTLTLALSPCPIMQRVCSLTEELDSGNSAVILYIFIVSLIKWEDPGKTKKNFNFDSIQSCWLLANARSIKVLIGFGSLPIS